MCCGVAQTTETIASFGENVDDEAVTKECALCCILVLTGSRDYSKSLN